MVAFVHAFTGSWKGHQDCTYKPKHSPAPQAVSALSTSVGNKSWKIVGWMKENGIVCLPPESYRPVDQSAYWCNCSEYPIIMYIIMKPKRPSILTHILDLYWKYFHVADKTIIP